MNEYIKGYQKAIHDVLVILNSRYRTYTEAGFVRDAETMNMLIRTILMEAEYEPNEEFICGYCGCEVEGRYLYCSQACTDADEKEHDEVPEASPVVTADTERT